jgi:hypothetical protein
MAATAACVNLCIWVCFYILCYIIEMVFISLTYKSTAVERSGLCRNGISSNYTSTQLIWKLSRASHASLDPKITH